MPYVKSLANLQSGPLAWVDTGLLPTGAAALLNKPTITEDLTPSTNQILPDLPTTSVAKTMVFTAPVDCTIRNLVGHITTRVATDPITYRNLNYFNMIGTITVAGTGPDVGTHVEGTGIHGAIFASHNLLQAPQLNLRLDAGDTVSITVHNYSGLFGSSSIVPYNYVVTYDEGQDASVKPTHFIGGPTTGGHLAVYGSAVAATGTITVTAASVTVGDTIVLEGWPSSVAGTSKIGSTLTAAVGGGSSGTDTWDSGIGGITAIRDAILAALSDASNSWLGDWTVASSGIDAITVTRNDTGSFANADTFATTSASISLTGSGLLTGGVGASITASAFATPSVGVTLDRLYMVSLGIIGDFPPVATPANATVTAVNVGGTPEPSFGQGQHSLDFNTVAVIHGNAVVPSSTTLSLDAHVQYPGTFAFYVLAGVVT
jgi:hypothetical protein